MKVSFPYMGTPIGYKKIAALLGHEVIDPPKPTQRTIDLGVKYSPEFACFPMKVLLGSYIEAIELGADTLISSGGHGPCRAGFYGEVQSKILRSMGYDVDLIIFDSIKRDFLGFYRKVKKIKGKHSWRDVWYTLKFSYHTIKILDFLEQQIETVRAYEVHKGQSTKVWEMIEKKIDGAYSDAELDRVKKEAQEMIDEIKLVQVPEEQKIRIGIVGEIYVVMESSVNMRVEERLGELGCEVRRSQYLSEWVDFNLIPARFSPSREPEILRKGEKYIEIIIGGHAKQNMGAIVDYKEQGFDGIVHLMPFGCLPELISQSIMPKVSEDLDIPVLTLSLDEQTGRANSLTRLEAFVDLIRTRKNGKCIIQVS
ncbi:MAG: CoA protein activase [Desulfitobacteriaceae bacterium]|nr:CoA protein activase [Desulfitobacteriaceae bacterium]